MFYNFLFPQYLKGKAVSFLLLLIRLFFGILFFMHGLDKLTNFNELSMTYPSVLGFGSYTTLMVAIFCEFACSMFLLVGLMTRIILIPMVLSMAVAFFDIHDGMMPEGELSLIYLVIFLGLFIAGPGRYSVDYLIDTRIQKEKDQKRIGRLHHLSD
jgi:putative oxidoreductase